MPALIITLTLNPALDLATTTDHVAPTHKLRCGQVRRFAGRASVKLRVPDERMSQKRIGDRETHVQLLRLASKTSPCRGLRRDGAKGPRASSVSKLCGAAGRVDGPQQRCHDLPQR